MNGICIIFLFGRTGIVVFDADIAVRKVFNEFLQLGIYLFRTLFLTLFHVELHHGNNIVGSILTGEFEICILYTSNETDKNNNSKSRQQ